MWNFPQASFITRERERKIWSESPLTNVNECVHFIRKHFYEMIDNTNSTQKPNQTNWKEYHTHECVEAFMSIERDTSIIYVYLIKSVEYLVFELSRNNVQSGENLFARILWWENCCHLHAHLNILSIYEVEILIMCVVFVQLPKLIIIWRTYSRLKHKIDAFVVCRCANQPILITS